MKSYLIVSESFNLIQEEINKIVEDNTLINFDLNNMSIKDLIYEATSITLDNKPKYILIKNSNIFSSKYEDVDKLINLLNNTTSIIIFTSNSIDLRLKLTKYFKENKTIINLKVDYKNIYNLVNEYVKNNKYTIDYDTTKYLVSLYGLNLDIIIQELKKMFLYFNTSKNIIYKDALEIISTPLNNNIYKFLDAVLEKDLSKSLSLLEDLIVYKIDESMIIILLAREYRMILNILILQFKKESKSNIMKTLKLLDWQLDKLYNKSILYSINDIKNYLHKLSIIDFKIKSGQIDKNIAIKTYLINKLS